MTGAWRSCRPESSQAVAAVPATASRAASSDGRTAAGWPTPPVRAEVAAIDQNIRGGLSP